MSETTRGGRRAKRFLTPSHKYEIWLQLVRQEVTIAEAAAEHQVDPSTIMRIRTVAKEWVLAALAVQARDDVRVGRATAHAAAHPFTGLGVGQLGGLFEVGGDAAGLA